MSSLMHIGTDKLAVETAGKLILAVLATSAGDTVKTQALSVIQNLTETKHITVSGCNLTGKVGK